MATTVTLDHLRATLRAMLDQPRPPYPTPLDRIVLPEGIYDALAEAGWDMRVYVRQPDMPKFHFDVERNG